MKRKQREPVKYSAELMDSICEQRSRGVSLRRICEAPGMPDKAAVRNWILDDRDGFGAKFKRAVEIAADEEFESIQDLADSAAGKDNAGVQAVRLQVDTAKWRLARIAPWKFGDKLEVTSGTNSAAAQRAIELHIVDHRPQLEPPTVDVEPALTDAEPKGTA